LIRREAPGAGDIGRYFQIFIEAYQAVKEFGGNPASCYIGNERGIESRGVTVEPEIQIAGKPAIIRFVAGGDRERNQQKKKYKERKQNPALSGRVTFLRR
jgi:hypothetical protein